MNDEKKPENKPEQGKPEEEATKGFPVVTEQDEEDAASFEMKKKDEDGNWVAATPVHVSDDTVPEQTETRETEAEQSEEDETVRLAYGPSGDKQSDDEEQKTEPLPQPPIEEERADAEPEDVEEEPDETPRRPKFGRGKRIAAAIVGAAAVVVAGFSIYVYTCDTIFPGVKVADDYKLSGMTQSEAQEYIAGDVQDALFSGTITLTGMDVVADNEKEYTIDIADLAESVDSASSAEQAYLVGREGGYFQRMSAVLSSMLTGWDISVDVTLQEGAVQSEIDEIYSDLTYDPVQPSWEVDMDSAELTVDTGEQGVGFDEEQVVSDITEKVQLLDFDTYEIETYAVDQDKPDAAAIAEDVNCDAQSATVDKSDGTTIIDEVDGVQVEESAIEEAIGDATEDSYTIPVTLTAAKVTAEELSEVLFSDTLASATTYYNSSNTGRTTNVRLAANACNSVILNPGEEFSYNDIVGERTAARGYQYATIFSDGDEVDGLGGGVCQTSSTIYMAVLRADLEVTERWYHQFQVSYTPVSQDATVYYGSKDFRFVNDTDYPVKLVISVGGGSLTVSIVGTKTDDKTVSLWSNTYTSGNYKYATLYKQVTVNGESTTTQENTSAYLLD